MIRLKLKPVSTEYMSIEGGEKLTSLLRHSRAMEADGNISGACELRLEGVEALLDAIVKAKPAAVKGTYLKSITLASTMGPGVKLNAQKIMNG